MKVEWSMSIWWESWSSVPYCPIYTTTTKNDTTFWFGSNVAARASSNSIVDLLWKMNVQIVHRVQARARRSGVNQIRIKSKCLIWFKICNNKINNCLLALLGCRKNGWADNIGVVPRRGGGGVLNFLKASIDWLPSICVRLFVIRFSVLCSDMYGWVAKN